MASTEAQPASEGDDPSDYSDQDTLPYSDDRAEEMNYQELAHTHTVATKTGDEDDFASDDQLGDERPGSKNSNNSAPLNSEDAALLESCTASPKRNVHLAAQRLEPMHKGKTMTRPDSEEHDTHAMFFFGEANRHQIDPIGTRKRVEPHTAIPVNRIGTDLGTNTQAETNGITRVTQRAEVELIDQAETVGVREDYEMDRSSPEMAAMDESTLQPQSTAGQPSIQNRSQRTRTRTDYKEASTQRSPNHEPDHVPIATRTQIMQEHASPQDDLFNAEPDSGGNQYPADEADEDVSMHSSSLANEGDMQHHEIAQTSSQVTHDPGTTTNAENFGVEHHPSWLLFQDTQAQDPLTETVLSGGTPSSSPQARPVSGNGSGVEHPCGDQHGDEVLHHLSDRNSPPRVTKKKKKKKARNADRDLAPITAVAELDFAEFGDHLQIMNFRYHRLEQHCNAELKAQNKQLRALDEVKRQLETQLENVIQRNQTLYDQVEVQQSALTDYRNIKLFIDGLGKDFNSLRDNTNANRREHERLSRENEAAKAERKSMLEDLNACKEQNVHLKHEAAQASQGRDAESKEAAAHYHYLEKRLSENVGLLTEERDRCARLEGRIIAESRRDEIAAESFKSSSDMLLDKLYEIEEAVKDQHIGTAIKDMMGKTYAAVQACSSQGAASNDDVAALRVLLHEIGESVSGGLKELSRDESNASSAVQTCLSQYLIELKSTLKQCEDRIAQSVGEQAETATLQSTLETYKLHVANSETKIRIATENEQRFGQEIATLQRRLAAKTNDAESSADEPSQTKLADLQAQLDSKSEALNAAMRDITSAANELRELGAVNTSLNEQVQALQARLQGVQSKTIETEPSRELIEKQAVAKLERARSEMAEHVARFETELKTKTSNEVKKLTSERHRFESQAKQSAQDLSKLKAQLEESRKVKASAVGKEDECVELKKQVHKQQEHIGSLQVSLNESASVHNKYHALVKQKESEKNRLSALTDEKSGLAKRVTDLQQLLEDEKRALEQASADLEGERSNYAAAFEALQRKYASAEEEVEESKAGHEQLEKTSQAAIKKEKATAERQIQALQQSLSEKEGQLQSKNEELQSKKEEYEHYCEDIEQNWQNEQEAHKKQIAEKEEEREQAMRDRESLAQQHRQALDEQRLSFVEYIAKVEDRAKLAEEQMSRVTALAQAHKVTPKDAAADGKTPSTWSQHALPSKPRKKVDRASATLVDNPVPVPEELRPDSRKSSRSTDGKPRGPIVEDSQVELTAGADIGVRSGQTQPETSLDQDNVLSVMDGEDQSSFRILERTDPLDRLLSFSAFNNSLQDSSQFPANAISSPAFSVPFFGNTQTDSAASQTHQKRDPGWGSGLASRVEHSDSGLISYDDLTQEDLPKTNSLRQSQSHSVNGNRQSTFTLSQAELDKCTFQKAYPPPNSSEKRVRQGEEKSSPAEWRSDSHASVASKSRNHRTPTVKNAALQDFSKARNTVEALNSSSPIFTRTGSIRKVSQYRTPGKAGLKRRSSSARHTPLVDPRLIKREASVVPKRKMGDNVEEGYEHELKKRLRSASHTATAAREGGNFNSRSQTHRSSLGMPNFSGMRAGPTSSQTRSHGTSEQPRMRTLAGGSSRPVKGKKGGTKHDEMNVRFSQELRRY